MAGKKIKRELNKQELMEETNQQKMEFCFICKISRVQINKK